MPLFSILMPTWGHEEVIDETLTSITQQDFDDYEVIIIPNGTSDAYESSREFWKHDVRIKFFMEYEDVGYCRNLSRCMSKANGRYILYFASDDIMGKGMLLYYAKIYQSYKVSAILRTYYCYDKNPQLAVRAKRRFDKDIEILNITSSPYEKIHLALETVDQLSGLSFINEKEVTLTNEDVFPCHAYPLFDILTRHYNFAYISKDFLAVRIGVSQARTISKIYRKSPIKSWAQIINKFSENSRFSGLKPYLARHWIGVNYVGMFQIKNFSERPYAYLVREIYFLLKINPALWAQGRACADPPLKRPHPNSG